MRHHALHLFAVAALGFGLAACSETRDSDRLARPDMPDRDLPDVAANDTTRPDADDTGLNTRDRDDSTLTPMDQSSADRDTRLTLMIRQKITDNDQLGTDAENVKVIAQNGVVTLRGPVETEAEKETIVSIARETEGVARVDDQLEVASR